MLKYRHSLARPLITVNDRFRWQDLNNLQAEGLAVEPAGKLSLTWGQIKAAARR